jgi:hypothetical protein
MHPQTLDSDSDVYFTSLANKILRALLSKKSTTEGLSEHLLRQFALKSAAYLEDVVSCWGLFGGFRKLHLQMFGKKLPFYTLDEDYYDDEINLEDIQFLLWTTMQEDINETEGGRFMNPENPGIALVSELIFCILEEEYETAPENERICKLLKWEYDDFFSLRKLLKWLCYNTYLSTNNAKNTLEEMKISVRKTDKENLPLQTTDNLIYLIESHSIFNYVCTPLSVNAIEWFRAITTNKNTLKKSENLACRAFQTYKIISSNKKTINLLPFCENETTLQLARESLNSLDKNSSREFQEGKETIQAALVFFDGLWHVNGMSIFTDMDDQVQTEENQKNARKKQHAENVEYSHKGIFKYNKNKPIAFFKDCDEWKKFWLGAFPETPNIEDYFIKNPFKNKRNILLFSYPKNGAFILPDAATLIKYPSNELYNKKIAQENGIALLTGNYPAPLEFLEFIIDNHYIPDARINSLKGVEYGRRLVQDNQWFIVRFFQPKLFESKIFDDLQFTNEDFD